MKDKNLRELLFGTNAGKFGKASGRSANIVYPSILNEPRIQIDYRITDGIFVELIKRIEKLEAKKKCSEGSG